jgi:methyl-galactoside transport system permease protein
MAEKILTAEQESKLRKPIDDYVGGIQEQINALRKDGTDQVIEIQSALDSLKRDRIYTAQEKEAKRAQLQKELEQAKAVEAKNKEEIAKLIADAVSYLKAHFDQDYYQAVKASCAEEKVQAQARYQESVAQLNKTHQETVAKLTDAQEIKDEKYVHKNRLFDAKMQLAKDLQDVKDRQHDAFQHQYHLIDLLRMSKFTFGENAAQRWENYKYTFNPRSFLLRNGLYLAIAVVFIAMCILAPTVKKVDLLTMNNILNILQQASPRMFLALGVAGLIMLAGTDLSIGRMMGMGMTAATIVMHKGINTGGVFGHIFDFTGMPVIARVFLALVVCIVLCTIFTSIAGFFTAQFKMHPFISTMSTMLMIFGLATYSTKGVSFGGIESNIPDMIIPKLGADGSTKFPTIILWAVAAVIVVWFIWNKTTFGKNLYAVGGNPEAASVSGISVFKVTMGAFIMAGILYGFGSWLECIRMSGSGSASYGQGWEMDAIAACVVGGVSFTGGIGKISGVVTGVFIFTALTYALTTLGIDANLQFVISGIIILVAVMLDCLKYVQKK